MPADRIIRPRARVLIDNDFGGDPDGLFQLVHHLLSPSVEVRGVIGSRSGGFFGADESAAHAAAVAEEILGIMNPSGTIPVYRGAETGLPEGRAPAPSPGADAIVREALRRDDDRPLFLCCGAGLTAAAGALLLEPTVADRLTVVWIGGHDPRGTIAPPGRPRLEYNLSIDIKAAQVVFNRSSVKLWQVPWEAYRQALVSHAELRTRVKPRGTAGQYLTERIENAVREARRAGMELGETYVLGDSPLVLLTALTSAFDRDTTSSQCITCPAPFINDDGTCRPDPVGRSLRVYTRLDTRLLFEDLFVKLKLFAG